MPPNAQLNTNQASQSGWTADPPEPIFPLRPEPSDLSASPLYPSRDAWLAVSPSAVAEPCPTGRRSCLVQPDPGVSAPSLNTAPGVTKSIAVAPKKACSELQAPISTGGQQPRLTDGNCKCFPSIMRLGRVDARRRGEVTVDSFDVLWSWRCGQYDFARLLFGRAFDCWGSLVQ